MFRQGDVILIPTKRPKASALIPAPSDARGIVLAEGETSGHHHAVFGDGAKLFRFRDDRRQERLLVLARGGDVRVVGGESNGVPRHHPVTLTKGAYLVRTQRFWSLEDARSVNVAD